MKAFNKYIISSNAICLLMLLIGAVGAANAQSLDSLVNAGLQNNQKLKSLAFKHTEHDARMKKAGAFPAPSVGLQFSQTPFSSPNLLNNAFSQNLVISQMIPLGGKISAMVDAMHSELPGVHSEIDDVEAQLTAAIKMSYAKWVQAWQKLEILKSNATLLGSLMGLTENQYNTSSQTVTDALLLQSEQGVLSTQIALTAQEIASQKLLLERYTGVHILTLPDTSWLTAQEPLLSAEEIGKILDDENPKLRSMQAMIGMNKAEAVANEKELYPDLMVEGMLMRMPQGMQLTSKTDPAMIDGKGMTEYMYSVGVSVTLPFLPWARKGIDAKSEELLTASNRISLELNDMRADMLAQIQNDFDRCKMLRANAATYLTDVLPKLEHAGESLVQSYRSGNVSVTRLLEVRKMLLMEKMNYFMTLTDAKMAYIEAEMMLGVQLDERNTK